MKRALNLAPRVLARASNAGVGPAAAPRCAHPTTFLFPKGASVGRAAVRAMSTSGKSDGDAPNPAQVGELYGAEARRKTTIRDIKKKQGPLTMLTAYDHPFARLVDETGVDMVLVGDSVGMVALGLESTVSVTMDEMVHHCKAVARGAPSKFLVGDMPFGSYLTVEDTLRNAARLLKEGGMDAVKLEGGVRVQDKIRATVDAGVSVMGHVGLTPQSAAALGGFVVQGKSSAAARELLADALAVQEAGAFAVVLECVPARLAAFITERLDIPTIGIGAGAGCAGQVQVLHDVLGLYGGTSPKFSRQFGQLRPAVSAALQSFVAAVEAGDFPNADESFSMGDKAWGNFVGSVSPPASSDFDNAWAPLRDEGPADSAWASLRVHRSRLKGRQQRGLCTSAAADTVAVIGNGALGCFLAARLSAAGARVLLVCRDEAAADEINRQGGVRLDGQLFAGVEATATIPEEGVADVAVLAVKAGDSRAAAEAAARLLKPDGFALSLQNGMGLDLAPVADRLASGVTSLGVTRVGSGGSVEQRGAGPTVVDSAAAARLLTAAGVPADFAPGDAGDAARWAKLAVSCAINPASALLGASNGAVPEAAMRAVVAEVGAVARASGVRGLGSDAELLAAAVAVARATAANTSSMAADVAAGRPTEVNFINGFVAARAAALGVPAPVNDTLAALVRARASPAPPRIARTAAELPAFAPGESVGFVPTMGALHEGHLSLVRRALAENDRVVVSIFVNPEQFAEGEDLDTYPRTFEADVALLRELGVDCVFAPDERAMYPAGQALVTVEVPAAEASREGLARPGFFRGVATVVSRLFTTVRPTRAYFGQKDAVQCTVVQLLASELRLPVEVVVVPTARAASGLALSSRNAYLTPAEEAVAPLVYRALQAAAGCADADEMREAAEDVLAGSAGLLELEYVDIGAGGPSLDRVEPGAFISIAVRTKESGTRLIDNVVC